MSKICIIPARGGSKRIPRKNIKSFLGKPILIYSIEAAIKSNLFDEVMVSTDDTEIAEIAEQNGAVVPFYRSYSTSGDSTSLIDVLIEVLNMYDENNKYFDTICCLLPTAPFVSVKNLFEADNLLFNGSYDSVIPVVEYSYPIQRSFRIEDKLIKMKWPEYQFYRSQDLEPSYHDTGQFYYLKRSTIKEQKRIFANKIGYLIMDPLEVQDIDTENDWKLAELKFNLKSENQIES